MFPGYTPDNVFTAWISIFLNWFLTVVSFPTSGLSLLMPGVVTITNENSSTIMKTAGIFVFLELNRLISFNIYEAATSTRNTAISGNHLLVRKFLIPIKGIPYA